MNPRRRSDLRDLVPTTTWHIEQSDQFAAFRRVTEQTRKRKLIAARSVCVSGAFGDLVEVAVRGAERRPQPRLPFVQLGDLHPSRLELVPGGDHDLDAMQAFYEEVVGLELVKRFEKSTTRALRPDDCSSTSTSSLPCATSGRLES
jgi:hypothetical protein